MASTRARFLHRDRQLAVLSGTVMLVDASIRSSALAVAHHTLGDPVDCLSRGQMADVDLALAHGLGIAAVAPPQS